MEGGYLLELLNLRNTFKKNSIKKRFRKFTSRILLLLMVINLVTAIVPTNRVEATSHYWSVNQTMNKIGRNQGWYNGLEMIFYENDKVRIAEEQANGKLVNYSRYIDTPGISALLEVPHTCTIRYTLLRGEGDRNVTGVITRTIKINEGDYRMMIVGWGWLESSSDIRVDSITITTLNLAPTTPSNITIPAEIRSRENIPISWGASIDSDGDSITYRLERSINGASYTQIYSGSSRNYTDSIPQGINTVAYRVRAYDGSDFSGYRTSPTRTVINNLIPIININEPLSNKRTGNHDNLFVSGSVKDADVGDIVKVKYSLANIKNREITLTQPSSIVSNGQNQSFQGYINLNGLTTGNEVLELYAEDNKGGISGKVNVPINIFNSLESILKGLKSYTFKSGQPTFMVVNTDTIIVQDVSNDNLINQIKQELRIKNIKLYFVGKDGPTKAYLESKLLR